MGTICSTHGGDENCLKEEHVWGSGCTWEDNIKVILKEISCGGVVWI